ncbi:MAG: hypothetical protein OXI63_21995 [Candidatus Poribacteria bacterium]|nr:hypothetical protein [Candidatus Poribacteria bacterium]
MKTSERIYDRLEDESAEHVKLTERQAAQAQADVEILQLQRDTLQILRDVGGMIKELKRELQELRLIMIDRQ